MRLKYNNTKVVIDGIRFDSKKESLYYLYLKSEKNKGMVNNFEVHPVITLQEGFEYEDKKIRAITYEPDFVVYRENGTEIVDVKGMKTDTFKLKWKMLQYQYKDLRHYKLLIV